MSIQVSIKKQNQITNQASFPTMEEAQAWLAHHKGMGTFGANEVYSKQPIVLSPAVYEEQQVLVKEAVTEEQELLNEEGLSFDPPQFQTVEISPAEYETVQVLVSPEVLEMEQILVKEAVTEEQELLNEEGQSFDPPQFETVEVEPAEYKEQPKLVDVLVSPAEYEVEIEDISAKLEQEKINAEALAFLDATDFYIIRELDNGVPCPADIKAERQAARERIVK